MTRFSLPGSDADDGNDSEQSTYDGEFGFPGPADPEITRSESNGRYVAEEPQRVDDQDNFRDPMNGEFVGDEFVDPLIQRDRDSGRFERSDR